MFQAESDSIKSRRKIVWRKYDENDDGASTMRRDVLTAKTIMYATLSRSGGGRQTAMLRRVIANHLYVAISLELKEHRITSCVPRDGLDHGIVVADIATLHEEAFVVRCDLSAKITGIVRATVRSQFATNA